MILESCFQIFHCKNENKKTEESERNKQAKDGLIQFKTDVTPTLFNRLKPSAYFIDHKV